MDLLFDLKQTVTDRKTHNVLEIIVYQHSQLLRFFVNINLLFQTGAFYCYVAILLSSMQCEEGCPVTLKKIDY